MADFDDSYPILNNVNTVTCTYDLTRKKHYYQPWATCYDCFSDDEEGACLACLMKCHKGHKLGKIKYWPFFCDCRISGFCENSIVQKDNIKIFKKRDDGSSSDNEEISLSHIKDDSPPNTHHNMSNWKLLNILGRNSVYSPLSISHLLSVLHLGAKGNTNKQLASFLGKKYTSTELLKEFDIFNNDVVKFCNALIVNSGKCELDKDYINKINKFITVSNDDFSNSNKIVTMVNHYIEKNTNGLINNVIDESHINSSSLMVLVNTLYFKAKWNKPFKISMTKSEPFFYGKDLELSTDVKMMRVDGNFYFYQNRTIKVLEISYENQEFVMGFVLPKSDIIFDAKDPSLFFPKENDMTYTNVEVHIPKFTHRKKIDLVKYLPKIGITDIFSSEKADLTLMSNKFPYVTSMIHEAVVIVDESGTEAAATTVACMAKKSATKTKKPFVFYANKPFIYYIKHVKTDVLLFAGNYHGN
ncbi:serpin [Tupanvirus soda lake]|uniref:Serpin n=2 Tax=Tupanvirus TaxID=2094720 RepID=A0A6N1NK57_9VIRU|nr:serpin [Tupanvirus soda lake]QKU34740.1 serpin [Tupanvirus soda lake]